MQTTLSMGIYQLVCAQKTLVQPHKWKRHGGAWTLEIYIGYTTLGYSLRAMEIVFVSNYMNIPTYNLKRKFEWQLRTILITFWFKKHEKSTTNLEYIVLLSHILLAWTSTRHFGRHFWHLIVKAACIITERANVFNMTSSRWNVEKNENLYIINIFYCLAFLPCSTEFHTTSYWLTIIRKTIVRCLGYFNNSFIIMNKR